MNGITYYRLKSDYPGDYTKNCALNGSEVDNNFYVLEGRDIKSIAADGKDILVTFLNGDVFTGKGILDFVKPSDIQTSVIGVEFDKLNGVLKLTNADGTIQHIEGFATNENTDFSVSTDNTLCGDGLRNAPLGVAPSAKTGQYKTVKSIINVAEGGSLPTCGNILGDRYVTCEDVSDYGYLYDYKAVREIACELKNTGWRIPTKEDWDNMLNAIEPCDCDKTHEKADKNKFLGKWAGKLLKSKTMWKNCDCCDCCEDDCGCHHDCDCHHHHDCDCHHHHDCDCHHHHDCGCHHGCDCGQNTCFDYSDDPCVGTKECESKCKCECNCGGEHKGLDTFGFRVTPAGYADDGCNFSYFRERSAFWTATTDQGATKAYIKRFQYNKDGVYQDIIASNYHLSLRLVKDYNGKNYFDVEEILDMEYPTLLLPSVSKGRSIWTSCNIACGNANLCPMLPNNGNGLTYTRHYFINEWNGFKWVRNEMKQGDTVTVAKAPKGKFMIEYRVVGNDLVSVNEMIYGDVMSDVKPIINDLEEKLTLQIEEKVAGEKERAEKVEAELWEAIQKEAQAREDVDNQQWDAIQKEAQAREDVDNQQWDAIQKEAQAREDVDNQQWDAIQKEAQAREDVDNQQWDAINAEAQIREDVDNQQWEAIQKEAQAREDVDNQQWNAINAEAQIREDVDNQQWEAIQKEAQAREDVDNQQWDAIQKEAQVREDVDNQQWDAIQKEAQAREDVDNQQWEAIQNEAQIREDVDNQQWNAIQNEAQTREEVDNQQWDAINTERDERTAKDEEIEGKLLTKEGTEFNPNDGVLTLKSAAGTNDISVQLTFNFGEF